MKVIDSIIITSNRISVFTWSMSTLAKIHINILSCKNLLLPNNFHTLLVLDYPSYKQSNLCFSSTMVPTKCETNDQFLCKVFGLVFITIWEVSDRNDNQAEGSGSLELCKLYIIRHGQMGPRKNVIIICLNLKNWFKI